MAEFVAQIDIRPWMSYLSGIQGRIKDKFKLLKVAFTTYGFADIIDHFEKERGQDGKWVQRAESTQHRYERIGSGDWKPPVGIARSAFNPTNKLLSLTGNLRQSLLTSNVRPRGDGLEFFANAEYSGVHDEGSPKKNIPQREFMWLSDNAMEKMALLIVNLAESGEV